MNTKTGYWYLHRNSRGEYVTYNESDVPLVLKVAPQKVGVFVDYEEGLVSFYDVDSADFIYSFTGCCFKEELFPVFNPGNNWDDMNSAPLILTTVKSNNGSA